MEFPLTLIINLDYCNNYKIIFSMTIVYALPVPTIFMPLPRLWYEHNVVGGMQGKEIHPHNLILGKSN